MSTQSNSIRQTWGREKEWRENERIDGLVMPINLRPK